MYEYTLENIKTGEKAFIWGISYRNAIRKAPQYDNDDWKVVGMEYVD